jgi:hypothetical protein
MGPPSGNLKADRKPQEGTCGGSGQQVNNPSRKIEFKASPGYIANPGLQIKGGGL